MDAQEAIWNLRKLSTTPPSEQFVDVTNSDLAFTGNYAIQGNYNGWQVWDISNPSKPSLKDAYVCPASQSDVSVYHNLLFVSGENLAARLDCGTQGVQDTVSTERLGDSGSSISATSRIRRTSETCRPAAAPIRTRCWSIPRTGTTSTSTSPDRRRFAPPASWPGCVAGMPSKDPNSAWFRIEVIKVPLAHPDQAKIVSSPRIFDNLVAPPKHGDTKEDSVAKPRRSLRPRPRASSSRPRSG
jgi:hypothetical protein